MSSTLFKTTKFAKKTSRFLANSSRSQKNLIAYGTDSCLFLVAIYMSLCIYSESVFPLHLIQQYFLSIILIIPIRLIIFTLLGMYRALVRYTEFNFLYTSLKSILLGYVGIFFLSLLFRLKSLPISVQVLDTLITLFLILTVRLFAQWLLYTSNSPLRLRKLAIFNKSIERNGHILQSVVIYGAGQAGFQLCQALNQAHLYRVVAFVDDNPQLWKQTINSIKVFNPDELPSLIERYQVSLILLAVPSATPKRKQEIMSCIHHLGVEMKTIPTLVEIVGGKVPIAQVRKIDITDLLGRAEVLPDANLLQVNIKDKCVLVTGAGGSIGTELCRQIAQQQPRHLVLYELNEFALYSIEMELREVYPDLSCSPCLGSITDEERFRQVITEYGVSTVYHAAAYKHVPLVEANVSQGVINNIYGTLVAARIANDCKVDTFVLISTDKAVRPTNVMGATKRVAELILQALAHQPDIHTHFIMVRFGNVINSTGSVVPRFQKQIMLRQSLTITHPQITRYFMSIPEAARLVIQAGAMGRGGEIFLLDMGEPVKIYDLAVQMVELSGLVLGKDIDIKVTGLRPGEKLYEELLIQPENARATLHPKVYAGKEEMIPWEKLEVYLDQLFLASQQQDKDALLGILKEIVPEYACPYEQLQHSSLASS